MDDRRVRTERLGGGAERVDGAQGEGEASGQQREQGTHGANEQVDEANRIKARRR